MRKQLFALLFGMLLVSTGVLLGCSQPPAAVTPGIETPTTENVRTQTPRSSPAPSPISTPVPSPVELPTATAVPSETAIPSPSFTATLASALSPTELKYRLIDQFGKIFFCDRDLYPVARRVSDEEVAQRVLAIQQKTEEYRAILKRLGLEGVTNLTHGQYGMIDAEHKRLEAIVLKPDGQQYSFSLRYSDAASNVFAVQGTLSAEGVITVTAQNPSSGGCPICLIGSVLIDTANSKVAVKDLQKGMLVWTATPSGGQELVPILETVRRPVPNGVSIVHLVLDDGRELYVSAGHPTADDRLVGDLVSGDALDGARVVSADSVPYDGGATYDILPAGETGTYWADGILLGSTLSR